MPKKIYICGPMTGYPNWNHEAFKMAELSLRAGGLQVFNPADNGLPASAPWEDHMRADIKELVSCDGVALLPGWQFSVGAKLEVEIATALRMRVMGYKDWIY